VCLFSEALTEELGEVSESVRKVLAKVMKVRGLAISKLAKVKLTKSSWISD
jgi:hypothetical protein